ncbi:hypothetical protein K491DRAFT_784776 [Lophiostoma macrostomum CBS 122681]|uniref:Uncharacterized protein n=1 Tax=Lophiostoma macrostomum CBS 122681 TaxID=1314788 RepID=A0A6A6SIE8_9PLEO|nr:hypothetical protein K491DRAFT_784776 [Lophiostoma macrostomum CBS 122681]
MPILTKPLGAQPKQLYPEPPKNGLRARLSRFMQASLLSSKSQPCSPTPSPSPPSSTTTTTTTTDASPPVSPSQNAPPSQTSSLKGRATKRAPRTKPTGMIISGDKTIYIPRYASKAHGSSFAGNRKSMQQLQMQSVPRSAMNPGPKKKTKPKRRSPEQIREGRGKSDPGPKSGCLRKGGEGGGEEAGEKKKEEEKKEEIKVKRLSSSSGDGRRRNPKLRSEYQRESSGSSEGMGVEGGEDGKGKSSESRSRPSSMGPDEDTGALDIEEDSPDVSTSPPLPSSHKRMYPPP